MKRSNNILYALFFAILLVILAIGAYGLAMRGTDTAGCLDAHGNDAPSISASAGWVKADLHMHTNYSDGSATPREIVSQAIEQGLNVIAITDHNTIDGALEARSIVLKENLPIQVIVGEEVWTEQGDLLAYFLEKRIAPGKLRDALSDAKEQGALTAAAHPYDSKRNAIKLDALDLSEAGMLDAIEVRNGRITDEEQNRQALEYALAHKKAMIANSDAHRAQDIGKAYMLFKTGGELDKADIIGAERLVCGVLRQQQN